MPLPPLPTALLAHRTLLAQLLPPLRRARPRVPFWQLRAHRVPTLWTLYRGLLRTAPTEAVALWVRGVWRREGRGTTSAWGARDQLLRGYKMLDVFGRAQEGDERCRAVLSRYDRLIEGKRRKEEWKVIERGELKRLHDLAHRPIVTGNITRGTIANRPFPMLKPQPRALTGMIVWRQRARERRFDAQALWTEWRAWIRDEAAAERMLGIEDGVYAGHRAGVEWAEPINDLFRAIEQTNQADYERAIAPLTPRQVAVVHRARRERIRNLTYLRQRELRGEVTRQAARRMRQGPPAPLLAVMSEKMRMRDRAVRGPSWGGYAGEVKRAAGMRERRMWSEKRWGRERRARGVFHHPPARETSSV